MDLLNEENAKEFLIFSNAMQEFTEQRKCQECFMLFCTLKLWAYSYKIYMLFGVVVLSSNERTVIKCTGFYMFFCTLK